MASAQDKSPARPKYALLISNSEHSQPQNRLPDAANNINQLSKLLKGIDFRVTTHHNLTKRDMVKQISKFSETISDGSLVLFYFFGFGCYSGEENYLIPTDDNQVETDGDFEDFTVNFRRQLDRLVDQNRSYVTIAVLDCPRAYVLKSASSSASKREMSGLINMKPPNGTFIQFACDTKQTVRDSTQAGDYSLFTQQLLKHITTENTHIVDLFRRISDAVYAESRSKQRPLSINGLGKHRQVYLHEVYIPVEIPSPPIEAQVTKDLRIIIAEQKTMKAHYDSFPSIAELTDRSNQNIRRAEQLTHSILSTKPSGNPTDRNTVCHALHALLGGQNQQCLFFDSTQGMRLHDASANLVDVSIEERPFVLQLTHFDGLGNIKCLPEQQHNPKFFQALNDYIEQKRHHPILDDVRHRLAKVHNVDRSHLTLSKVYQGSACFVYNVRDQAKNIIDSLPDLPKKLMQQFEQMLSAKIHPLLFRPSFDVSMFDERGNKTFGEKTEMHQVGPIDRKKEYRTPAYWTRYGLKVLDRFSDNLWLEPFGHPGNWYRAYHGTGRATAADFGASGTSFQQDYAHVDAMASIHQAGFRPARVAAYGAGVYCSPYPEYPEKNGYVRSIEMDCVNGKKHVKCMLQVAVNPDGVKCGTNEIWVVEIPENIRAYGILIKEDNGKTSRHKLDD